MNRDKELSKSLIGIGLAFLMGLALILASDRMAGAADLGRTWRNYVVPAPIGLSAGEQLVSQATVLVSSQTPTMLVTSNTARCGIEIFNISTRPVISIRLYYSSTQTATSGEYFYTIDVPTGTPTSISPTGGNMTHSQNPYQQSFPVIWQGPIYGVAVGSPGALGSSFIGKVRVVENEIR